MPVVSKGRALPLAGLVRQGSQGPCPEALYSALVEQGQELLPPRAQVVRRGDGAFDGTRLQPTMQDTGWSSVCRPGSHGTAAWDGEPLRLDTVGWWSTPGTLVACPEASMTRDAYGPILLLCGGAQGEKEPL